MSARINVHDDGSVRLLHHHFAEFPFLKCDGSVQQVQHSVIVLEMLPMLSSSHHPRNELEDDVPGNSEG